MTRPEDPDQTPEHQPAGWAETRATLGQLFGTAPQGAATDPTSAEPVSANPASTDPASPDTASTDTASTGSASAEAASTEAASAGPSPAGPLPAEPVSHDLWPPEQPVEAAAFDLLGHPHEALAPTDATAPITAPEAGPTSPVQAMPDTEEGSSAAPAPAPAGPAPEAPKAAAPPLEVHEVRPPDAPPAPTSAANTAPVSVAAPAPTPPVPAAQSVPAPEAEATAVSSQVATPVAVPVSSGGISDDLEEQLLAPSAPVTGPQVGQVVSGFHLNEDLGRGWFTANEVSSGPSQDVYVRPDPLWAALLPHRLLPKTRQVGDLRVLEPTDGERLPSPLPAPLALQHLRELARLLFALEKQGYAVTDLDPQALRLTPAGLKLRFPPRVARLGDVPEPVLREGFTPPELLAGQPAQAQAGVYLLGALLYGWLTGRSLPPEGPSLALLGGVAGPGLPQLLHQMLAPQAQRPTPAALLDLLKTKFVPAMPAYQVAAATTVGLNPDRPTNEDSYGFRWHQVDADGFPEQVLRATVSDGMGGMAAGEVASRAAVRAFLTSDKTDLAEVVWEANAAVLDAMQGRDGGCTISGVEVRGDQLGLGHVGDTRAYLRQGGEVRQLTKDHSYVAAMVASGQLTEEEAQHSPDRNKVLRSLGSVRVPQPNYVQTLPEPLTLQPGDRVLLVSDGVWGEVDPETLKGMLSREPNLQSLVDQLIELSLQAGAPDNATALVIERVK